MIERCKMNTLVFCLQKINKFGFLDQPRVREIFLIVLKKVRQSSLNLKIKLNSISTDMIREIVSDAESLKVLVQGESDKYNTLYLRFIEDCEQSIKDAEKNVYSDKDSRFLAMKV